MKIEPGDATKGPPQDAPKKEEEIEVLSPHVLTEPIFSEAIQTITLKQRAAELQAAVEHRERQIAAAHRLSEALIHCPNVDAMVQETLNIALDVLGAGAGSLLLYDPGKDTLVFRYVVGPPAGKLTGYAMPASEGIIGQVFRTGVPDLTCHINADGAQDFNHTVNEKGDYSAESVMTVPVQRPRGTPIGVMQVLSTREQAFDCHDLEVLQVLCTQAAATIQTARLAQRARKAEIVNIIGDISHDIKNMLTPIQSGLLTLEPLLDQLFNDLDKIRTQFPSEERWVGDIERSTQLVREEYGFIISGALEACDQVQARTREIADAVKGQTSPPLFEEADLNETVMEVARPLYIRADKTNVFLELDLDHDLPKSEFDRKQMYNALYNLVNNAIDATPDRGSVTIRTRGPQPGEDSILIEVEDTGKGIPEHILPLLFTDAVVSTKPGGTGLGTRIVGDVVRRHNGTINAQSEVGKGTTFSIRIPLRRQS